VQKNKIQKGQNIAGKQSGMALEEFQLKSSNLLQGYMI